MYKFFEDEKFLEARKNKQYFLWRRVLLDTPSWDEVLRDLEISIEENSPIKIGQYFSIITHRGEKHIPLAAAFLEEMKKLDVSLPGSAHVYTGLTKYSQGLGKHNDNADVCFWQIIGSSNWKVYAPDGMKEHVLEVGDVIYVPRYMEHEVTSLGPRVGISFGLDYAAGKAAG